MMSSCAVETLTAGFARRTWPTSTSEQAEAIARKLSVAAIQDPTYPNPFFVLESDGKSLCHYLGGARHQTSESAVAA